MMCTLQQVSLMATLRLLSLVEMCSPMQGFEKWVTGVLPLRLWQAMICTSKLYPCQAMAAVFMRLQHYCAILCWCCFSASEISFWDEQLWYTWMLIESLHASTFFTDRYSCLKFQLPFIKIAFRSNKVMLIREWGQQELHPWVGFDLGTVRHPKSCVDIKKLQL